ncbi:phosphotransferase [archaeon]|nr:phosphotransferase [archaeon]
MGLKEIKIILGSWDLGRILSHKKTEKGVVNLNWIVRTTKGKYILRELGKSKKLKELKFELKYLDYLKRKKFPYKIPSPIKNRKRESFIKKGGSIFWVYEFIEGRDIKRFGYPELKECAKMMAIYHQIIENSGIDNKTSYSDFAREEILEEIKSFQKEIGNSPKDEKEKIFLGESNKLLPLLNNLNVVGYSKLKKYSLHRDIGPENTLWKNKKLVGVIDFENVGEIKDTLIKDLAVMLQYSCRDKTYKYKLDLKLVKFFLKEYKKHHPLSRTEISFIPEIIIAGAIEDFSYSYWMLIHDPERAKLYRLKLYSKVAQWFNQNKNEILKEITW